MPALDLSVRSRVKRQSVDVSHTRNPNELLEVFDDELRPIVRDYPGPRFRVTLIRPPQDDLDVRLGHRLPDVPVHDVPAETIRDAAQVIKRPADVRVGNIDVRVMCHGTMHLTAFTTVTLRKGGAVTRKFTISLRECEKIKL